MSFDIPLRASPTLKITAEQANKNVIASPETIVKRGVTVVKGTAAIVPGQVLGIYSAVSTGKAGIYSNAGANGLETARAIALNFVPANADFDQVTEVAIHGVLYLDQLVGWDAAAKADFGADENSAFNTVRI